MGWNCSINLYLPAANLGAGLLATAKFAEQSSTFPCVVLLPDMSSLSLPFGRLDESTSPQLIIGREPVALHLSLITPVDEVIEEWWEEEPYMVEGSEYVGIGLIRLWLSVGSRYAELKFHGPSGDVSTILSQSRAVQRLLGTVLHEAGGLAGAIIPDDGPVRLLTDPTVELKIDWAWVNRDGGDSDSDKLAVELINQIVAQQEE